MERILEYCRKYDNVIIYGAGKIGEQLGKDLILKGIKLQYYVVSSKDGQRDELNGVKIESIDNIKLESNTGIILGAVPGKAKQMAETLDNLGRTDYLVLEQEYIDNIVRPVVRPKVEITTEIGCKVNCKYCPQKLLISRYFKNNNKRTKRMSFDTFKICLDKVPQNTNIYFAGMVEPFQNPECMDMIRYTISKEGYVVAILTTAVGLKEEMALELVKMPIEEFCLHVPDEEEYAKIPLTEEYWKVVSILLDAKKSNGQSFIDVCSCQGTPLKEFMDINNGRVRVESFLHDRAGHLENTDNKLASCAEKLNGEIYCCFSKKLDNNILLPDGTMVLCCMDYGLEYPLGNLCEMSYEDILEGEALSNIRKALMDDRKDLLCRNCTYAVKYKEV